MKILLAYLYIPAKWLTRIIYVILPVLAKFFPDLLTKILLHYETTWWEKFVAKIGYIFLSLLDKCKLLMSDIGQELSRNQYFDVIGEYGIGIAIGLILMGLIKWKVTTKHFQPGSRFKENVEANLYIITALVISYFNQWLNYDTPKNIITFLKTTLENLPMILKNIINCIPNKNNYFEATILTLFFIASVKLLSNIPPLGIITWLKNNNERAFTENKNTP